MSGFGMPPPDPDTDLDISGGGPPWSLVVGAAATDGAMFRPNRWHVEPYRKHVERKLYALLARSDTYTALPLVRVVRCAWLETFGVKGPCETKEAVR